MMNYKRFLLLSLIACVLVAAFAVTGAFAYSSTTGPTFHLGSDPVPVFSQVIDDETFAVFLFDNFTDWTSSSVSSFDDMIWVPAFNDIDFACKVSTDGDPSQGFTLYFRQGSTVSTNRSLSIMNLSQGVCLKISGSYGTIKYGRYISSTFLDYNSGSTITAFHLNDYTLGSSFEWSYAMTGEVLDFAIEPGYAYIIEGQFEVLERSYYINNSWNFLKNGSLRVNGSSNRVLGSSNIRDGFSPDRLRPFSELIQWEAVNPNLFGTASIYEFYSAENVSISNPGEAYVISYPTLFGTGSVNSVQLFTNSVDMICSVYINYVERPTLRYVAIESLSEYSSSGDFSTYSVFRPGVYDEEAVSTPTTGGTIVTPDGNIPSGGGNIGQPPVDEDTSIIGILSRFVNRISLLFNSAGEAIHNIVNATQTFFSSVLSFFGWLPPEWSTVLWSFFLILTVLGVVKAFL